MQSKSGWLRNLARDREKDFADQLGRAIKSK